MKLSKQEMLDILENAVAYIAAFGLIVYGSAKGFQFEGAKMVEKNLAEMTKMELMWSFYGASKPYVIIIGVVQIISGILLIYKPTRIIGGLLATAVLFNIILQDYFYDVLRGALFAAVWYQAMICIIFFLNRTKIINGIKDLLIPKTAYETRKKWFLIMGASLALFVIIRILESLILYFSI